MTKEEIIELAEKAGIIPLENATNALGKSVPLNWLIEFAKLIRADYGKLHASLWLKRIDDAVKKEREECAKVALQGTDEPVQTDTLEILKKERQRISDAIKNRMKKND